MQKTLARKWRLLARRAVRRVATWFALEAVDAVAHREFMDHYWRADNHNARSGGRSRSHDYRAIRNAFQRCHSFASRLQAP